MYMPSLIFQLVSWKVSLIGNGSAYRSPAIGKPNSASFNRSRGLIHLSRQSHPWPLAVGEFDA
jgi:hypothetical protein